MTTTNSNYRVIIAALDDYTKQTGIDLAKNPFAEKLLISNSPDAIIEILQDQVKAFQEYRDGNRKLINWLSPAVKVLYAFSGILGEVLNLVPFQPAKAIFVGIGVLLDAASGVSASYDALVDVFECIGNFLKRVNVYTEIPFTPAMTDIVVKILIELLSVLSLATKQIKQGRFKKFAKKLLGESEVEAVLQRLDRLTQEEARMTVAQTLEVVHSLVNNMRVVMDDGKASTDCIRQTLVTMQLVSSEINRMKRDQLQKAVQHWLSPPDPSTNHGIICEAYPSGTAAWFFKGSVFTEWKEKGSLLWIHGKPGSGKSTLLSSIIQDIEGMRATGLASMAYYYFDFRDAEKQNRHGILSSLLAQLCTESNSCYDILSRLYSAHASGTRKPTGSALTKCLKDMLKIPGQGATYIIVDALDECPNTSGISSAREKVLELIEELVDLHLPHVHVCVTSRPEIDIRNVLEPLTTFRVSLHDESGQRQDIIDYISSVVHADRRMRKWRVEDQKLVINTLSEKADGMFRWVVCQLETLRRSFPASIRGALDDLPKSLDETYEHILLGIDEEKREYAHRLLQCLTVSIRPLRIEELAEILAVQFEAGAIPNFNSSWRPVDAEEAVLSACSSLISIVNVDGFRVAQFSHFSVKEFLTSDRLATAGEHRSRYHVLPELAHTIMAHASLSVLLNLDNRIDKSSIKNFPFASYAARHWVDHAKFEGVSSRIQGVIEILFDLEKPHFAPWVWLYNMDSHWEEPMPGNHPTRPKAGPLYYATLCGLRGLVEHLVYTYPRDVNARGGVHVTPLHAASGKGYAEVALLLLQHGADPNLIDNEGFSPLHKASLSGHLDIVRLLLGHGAQINLRNKKQQSPLDRASVTGKVDVVRSLLKHGADVNSRDNQDCTPLHRASQNGYTDVVRLLLEGGADVQARENEDWTPLHIAAQNGHHSVVQLLLERGANVNALNNQKWTPLHIASHTVHIDVVRLLLDCGADANASDDEDWTPLHIASRTGRLDIVRLLLDYEADVNAQNGNRETPWDLAMNKGKFDVAKLLLERNSVLNAKANESWVSLHAASKNGYLDDVRSLLERGEDVNAQNKNLQTPLLLSSGNGRLEVSRLLLEKGADINSRDKKGWTALHVASKKGHLNVVRLLLDRGADVNALNVDRETPLDQASGKGNVEVVHLLITHGANVNAQDKLGWTPLHTASRTGHLNVVRSLVGQGANVNAKNKNQQTPLDLALESRKLEVVQFLREHGTDANHEGMEGWTLHTASRKGRVDMVELLLERGEDINAQNRSRETPLDLASYTGHFDVAQLLLERGANVNSRDNDGWTPLHSASRKGHLDVVSLLLEHGADINAQNKNQWTPLYWASNRGHFEVVRFLLQKGAIAHLRNDVGKTPFQAALAGGHREVVQLLSAATRVSSRLSPT